ncbi:unnamed protein product [Tilletia controversa]|uniref:GID complex catalytic subunit 2 n=3 Tax=Tilletia TaxID=13289 RepID=A0A8X7MJ95_9BASI|nr:hypothetical protein CF336_g8959 [Tilletia laevis]KAE8181875.1 hypothetical protein CF328_g8707 [Tilletia controversa]KAE8239154.1 hypothetical protein A4X03_0g8691 [Tilletia caries]KAE8182224.1 hypothetical protein CF335_g8697 [Tilletia laevis]KAE8237883.1 hypothetical protein A4X06_0g9070 [Tilletia controversa]
MDNIQKELERTTKKAIPLVSSSSKASLTTVNDSLDQLINKLESAKARLASTDNSLGPPPPVQPLCRDLAASIDYTAKSIADKQAEYEGQLSKLGKAIDRKFPIPISTAAVANPGLFSNRNAQYALQNVILDHLLRNGSWQTADIFAKETGIPLSSDRASVFERLHSTLEAIERGDLSSAIDWACSERDFLEQRGSSLEFALHRSQFLRIAVTGCRPIVPGGDEHDDEHALAMATGGALENDGDTPMASGEDSEDEEAAAAAVGGNPTISLHAPQHLPPPPAPATSFLRTGSSSSSPSLVAAELTNKKLAFAYARKHFHPFLHSQILEVQRLYCLLMFLPEFPAAPPQRTSPRIPTPSPSAPPLSHFYDRFPPLYHPLLNPNLVHAPALLPLFRLDYCAHMGVAREPPLKIAVEIGAGGALSRIMKVRQVMKIKGTEWSQADELPVEIPLPNHLRFHSTFACPVSKEQGTDANPPVMMACGHVVCQDSLDRLSKGTGRVKCPYCPIESSVSQALRVYF